MLAAGRCPNRSKAPPPRTVTEAVGSNAQSEQFNRADTDDEHGECDGIVVQPIPLRLHGTPPCSHPISRPSRQLVQMHHKALELLVKLQPHATEAWRRLAARLILPVSIWYSGGLRPGREAARDGSRSLDFQALWHCSSDQEPTRCEQGSAGFAGNRRPSFPARTGIEGEIPWLSPATTRRQSYLHCLFALSAFRSLHLPMPGRRTDKARMSSRDTRTRRRA